MRSHDICQSYQEYHSCLFNHMGDYDSLCAVLTTKKRPPLLRTGAYLCENKGRGNAALVILCIGISASGVRRFQTFGR